MNVQVIIVSGYDYFEYTKSHRAQGKQLSPETLLGRGNHPGRDEGQNAVIEEQNRKQMISEYQDLFNQYKTCSAPSFCPGCSTINSETAPPF